MVQPQSQPMAPFRTHGCAGEQCGLSAVTGACGRHFLRTVRPHFSHKYLRVLLYDAGHSAAYAAGRSHRQLWFDLRASGGIKHWLITPLRTVDEFCCRNGDLLFRNEGEPTCLLVAWYLSRLIDGLCKTNPLRIGQTTSSENEGIVLSYPPRNCFADAAKFCVGQCIYMFANA